MTAASPLARLVRHFRSDKVAVVALAWLGLCAAVALTSAWWTPHPPNLQFVGGAFSPPGNGTWLGTDDLGRDILSRLMAGAAVSFRVSLTVVGIALAVSVPLGLVAGYRGGWVDALTMRTLDAITSVPGVVAALAIVGVLGNNLTNVILALGVIVTPSFVRLIRSQALSVSSELYISASRSVGSRTPWILVHRVLPGVLPALSVQISLALGSALTAEAALSFLGLGVQAPDATWGNMLSRAYRNLLQHPDGLVAPMVAIGSVVLAFNLVGDALRDSLGIGIRRRVRRRTRLGLTTVDPLTATVLSSGAAPGPPAEQARLIVTDLCVELDTSDGTVEALDHVSLSVAPGEVLGLVGESGSGKTLTAMSIMRLLQSPPARITGGSITFDGRELLSASFEEMRAVRGSGIGMVFQNPMSSLDPSFTIGSSLREAIRNHSTMSRAAANRRAVELLGLVGIPSAASRLDDHPHRFSGGMRQRVMLAMALAGEPSLLIADEPTTALDVTVQAQMLELLDGLRGELGMSMVLITHDLGVVAQICDTVSVMYAGQVVESAAISELFTSPKHPYTAGLLDTVRSASAGSRRLAVLPGLVPSLAAMPVGCRFAARCAHAVPACVSAVPPLTAHADRSVRCGRADELHLQGS